jgi:peptidoglycan/LPS O-acetylase OafA/YrhL
MAFTISDNRPAPTMIGGHVPALDGLRGVAVLLVLAFHLAHLDGAAGLPARALLGATRFGWSGVDLFFVLSGFLITGILLDAKGAPGYFRSFYVRRALRIFPLYYAYLAVLFWAVPRLAPVGAVDVHPGSQAWMWTYLSNVLFAREGGFHASPYAGHFWSLAVEEQFYLAWPLAVWLFPRRWLAAVALALVGGAFALRLGIHRTTFNATAAYVLTPARADALAVGALVAIGLRTPGAPERMRRAAPWALAASAAAVAALWWARGSFFGGDPSVQVWGFGPLALGYAAVLVLALPAAGGPSRLGRALSAGWLRSAGRYSYGLYVLHYPIFLGLEALGVSSAVLASSLGSELLGILAFAAIGGGASIAGALLSWHLIEKRFLALKDRVPYGRAAVAPAPGGGGRRGAAGASPSPAVATPGRRPARRRPDAP